MFQRLSSTQNRSTPGITPEVASKIDRPTFLFWSIPPPGGECDRPIGVRKTR
ncbi:MAG: hypothetical protein HC789_01310 [Microcoleus sp. CSU_2_2]|nr:hypothetical protein [Microcoleus sp. SU_5_3]NJS09097.1 hypothetical protein [Microcoleus sp. CSU_2_2]